jgi:hypothetical protein
MKTAKQLAVFSYVVKPFYSPYYLAGPAVLACIVSTDKPKQECFISYDKHNGIDKMIIGAPKEIAVDEKRVAMTPDSATQLQKLGYDCLVQSGAGLYAGFSDAAYEKLVSKLPKRLQNCGKPPISLAKFARQRQVKSSS